MLARPGPEPAQRELGAPAGHELHMPSKAAKGIIALGAFAKLLEIDGQVAASQKYMKLSQVGRSFGIPMLL